MSSAEIGGRMPTSSALSAGTASVRSPWATFRTRYSVFSPKASRVSFRSITAAPWWGYTTRSPTLKAIRHSRWSDVRCETGQSTRAGAGRPVRPDRALANRPDTFGRSNGCVPGQRGEYSRRVLRCTRRVVLWGQCGAGKRLRGGGTGSGRLEDVGTARRSKSRVGRPSPSVAVLDPDGTIAFAGGDDLGGIAGHAPATIEGRSLLDFVHPEDLMVVLDHFGAVRDRRTPTDEVRGAHPRPRRCVPRRRARVPRGAGVLRRVRLVPRRHGHRHGRGSDAVVGVAQRARRAHPVVARGVRTGRTVAVPEPRRARDVRGHLPRGGTERDAGRPRAPGRRRRDAGHGSPKRRARRAVASRASSASAARTSGGRCKSCSSTSSRIRPCAVSSWTASTRPSNSTSRTVPSTTRSPAWPTACC